MKIRQALIAAGGKGSRLKAGGIPVPISKAFIELQGKPLLYWCLWNLYSAGIKEVIITVSNAEQAASAEHAVRDFPYQFERTSISMHPGFDTTCKIPYFYKEDLDQVFLYEFGHSLSSPEHYRLMSEAKLADNIIFSGFEPDGYKHHPVFINKDYITLMAENDGDLELNLGAPYIFDQKYLELLPSLQFSTENVIAHYTKNNKLRMIVSELPTEFNTADQFSHNLQVYERFIRKMGFY